MGTRAATEERRPIAYFDRALQHPAVICTGMVCLLAGFLGVLYAGVYCLEHRLDTKLLLDTFGPGAIIAALLALLNGTGVVALIAKLARIERNTGTTEPAPTYRGNDTSALYSPPGAH